MKKYFKFFVTASIVAASFAIAPFAFADVTFSPEAPTTPQASFSAFCDPYLAAFTANNYYTPDERGSCTYGLPTFNTGTQRLLALYKGVIGNATLQSFATYDASVDPQTIISNTNNIFGGTQGDNFFLAAVGGNVFNDLIDADTYLRTGAGTPLATSTYYTLPFIYGTAPTTTPLCTPGSAGCNSNVMFLPGIEGSSLFDSSFAFGQVWDPNFIGPNTAATLDLTNASKANTIFTGVEDIIGTAYQIPVIHPVGYNVYSSFVNQMNAMATGTTSLINQWEPIAYDWRLDYQKLLDNGNETDDGKIYYTGTNAATSTPYIIQELKKLAATSRTGKVTIVAHSNGGLLAKALLMQPGISQYVDKVIMVATPQLGTPEAVGAILNGSDTGLERPLNLLFNNADGRFVSQNMPTAYNLLPSTQFFVNTLNPIVTFDSSTLLWMATKYGSAITSTTALRSFMTDSSRPTPSYGDLTTSSVANSSLFDNATTVHSNLDNWTPPAGVQLITIAGWGVPTLVTLNYKKIPQPLFDGGGLATTTDPITDIDGDGTVLDTSAQWSLTSTSTKYWVDFSTYNKTAATSITHANILTSPSTLSLLNALITNSPTSSLPQFVTVNRPTFFSDPRIQFVLHSPLTLGFTDSSGNYTGSTATTTSFNVPGVQYQRFGEVQWLSVPASMAGQVVMQGTGTGSFALDIQSVNGDATLATTTFAAVPSATSTVATMNISPSVSPTTNGVLQVDFNGDGTVDSTLHAVQGSTVLPDTVPPELKAIFNTTTDSIGFIGSDDSGSTTLSTVTSSGISQNGGTLYNATTTATDPSGNTATLAYTSFVQTSGTSGKDLVTLSSLAYNGAIATTTTAKLQYMWQVQNGALSTLMTNVTTSTSTVQAQWHLNQNTTSIMVRQNGPGGQTTQTTLSGDVIPFVASRQGAINYGW